jgi:Transposase zinc-binding domain
MTGHRLEVADVFHAHQDQFLQRWGHALSDQQRKVLRDIGLCRTAALGTHLERCDRCSYETVAYDSCRNRHCPKCQSSAPDRWLLKQAASLLPVPYVHAVFTVPEQLGSLALRNQRLFYSMLFRAASETLLEIATASERFCDKNKQQSLAFIPVITLAAPTSVSPASATDQKQH